MAKLFIEDTTLTSIGDAIRSKAGTTELIPPLDMATAITNLPAGTQQEYTKVFSGDCSHLNGPQVSPYSGSGGQWDWILEGKLFPFIKIKTKDVTECYKMFYNSSLVEIPFAIDLKGCPADDNNQTISFQEMFYSARYLKKLPEITNSNGLTPKVRNITLMFGFTDIEHIPDTFMDNCDFSPLDEYSDSTGQPFWICHKLRAIPAKWLSYGNPQDNLYLYNFYECMALDELVLPDCPFYNYDAINKSGESFINVPATSRLKRLVLPSRYKNGETQFKWGGCDLALTYYVGYYSESDGQRYAPSTEFKMFDTESYNRNKDNPDAWTDKLEYSRYNKISAIETLNSLPDTSNYAKTYGANTIQFQGNSGSLTDGGAINTIDEATIAAAAAKGWTVTMV